MSSAKLVDCTGSKGSEAPTMFVGTLVESPHQVTKTYQKVAQC